MTRLSPNARAYGLLAVVMLCWAGNSIVGRAVRADVGPFALAFGRWLIASLVVLPFAAGRLRADAAAIRAGWRWIAGLGFLGVVCFNALLYAGLQHTGAANALLLQAAIPAGVLVLDAALFGTRARAAQVTGVALSTLGVVAIVARGDAAALWHLRFGPGDGLVLLGVVVWALYTVLLRKKPPVSAPTFLLLTFALGAVALAPLAAWEVAGGRALRWSPGLLGAFAYVGLFPSVLAYFLYNTATERVGAARAGLAITLMPLFGALLSALLLGEALEHYHLAGMALILAGIVLSGRGGRAKSPVAPSPSQG